MKLLFGHDKDVAAWVAKRIPHMHGGGFPPSTAIGVLNAKGELVGGVVFHNYVAVYRSIEWSAAASDPRWLTPRLISQIVSYPFNQLGCKRITAIIPRKNKRAREFHHRFGFRQEGRCTAGFGSDDAIIYGLLPRYWKYSRFNVKRIERPAPEAAPELAIQH